MNTCFIGSLNFGFMLNILKFLANMSVQPVRLLVTCAQYIYFFLRVSRLAVLTLVNRLAYT